MNPSPNRNVMLGMYLFSESLKLQESNVVSGITETAELTKAEMREVLEAICGGIIGLSQTLHVQNKDYKRFFSEFADSCRRI